MKDLSLYYMPSCPYCGKVLNYMKTAGIEIPLKNTSADSSVRQELISIGGKSQVPCLIIDGKALYESDDIIEWLRNNKPNNS